MAGKDHYKTLGVDRSASADEIKRAYRRLSKQHHPDRNPDDPSAEDRFKEVQHAYSVLKDTDKRAQYDRFGDVAVGDFHTDPRGQQAYQWGGGSSVNVEDLEELFSAFGGGGARRPSVFDQFFRRGKGQPTPPRPQRGPDEDKTLSLTFMQAVEGTTLEVHLRSGQNGSSTEKLEVKIPAGVEHGQRIRLKGRGHVGAGGGPRGDLFLVCSVAKHPFFVRQGTDIHLEVPVTISEAALGAKIEIPSIAGPTTVTIPPGTPGGTKLRLKNRGMTTAGKGKQGHQYIVIRIVPPPKMSDDQRKLFEQLKEHESDNPRANIGW